MVTGTVYYNLTTFLKKQQSKQRFQVLIIVSIIKQKTKQNIVSVRLCRIIDIVTMAGYISNISRAET